MESEVRQFEAEFNTRELKRATSFNLCTEFLKSLVFMSATPCHFYNFVMIFIEELSEGTIVCSLKGNQVDKTLTTNQLKLINELALKIKMTYFGNLSNFIDLEETPFLSNLSLFIDKAFSNIFEVKTNFQLKSDCEIRNFPKEYSISTTHRYVAIECRKREGMEKAARTVCSLLTAFMMDKNLSSQGSSFCGAIVFEVLLFVYLNTVYPPIIQ